MGAMWLDGGVCGGPLREIEEAERDCAGRFNLVERNRMSVIVGGPNVSLLVMLMPLCTSAPIEDYLMLLGHVQEC